MVNAEMGSLSLEQVDIAFDQHQAELSNELAFVQGQLAACTLEKNPNVYLCLARSYVQNSQTTLTDVHNLFSKIIKDLDIKTEEHWYTKLGELAGDYADFCIKMKKPIKGIHTLQVGITKIQ